MKKRILSVNPQFRTELRGQQDGIARVRSSNQLGLALAKLVKKGTPVEFVE